MAEPEETTPKPVALKDRIAGLKAGAAGAGDRLARHVKALQAAAPGAAAELSAKVKAGLQAARIDGLNRETLKAGRDTLAAKLEQVLKARPVDGAPTADGAPAKPPAVLPDVVPARADQTGRKLDLEAIKAKLDAAVRAGDGATARAASDVPAGSIDAMPQPATSGPSMPSGWTTRFKRTTAPPTARTNPSAPLEADADISTLEARPPTGAPADAARTDDIGASPATARSSTEAGNALRGPDGAQPAATVQAGHEPATGPSTVRTTTVRTSATPTTAARRRRAPLSIAMLATSLVTGGILHIVTTFAIPLLNTGSAFDRLKWQLETNAMKILEPDALGGLPLPFLSPDNRYAMCRFDISQGGVYVSAVMPDIGWSLTLYTPQGDNFYAVPGQEGRTIEANFNIVPASDRLLLPVPGQRRSDTDASQVTSPTREGLVVVRAPNRGAAHQYATETALRRVTCRAIDRR